MVSDYIKYLWLAVILFLLQFLVLNNIDLFGYANPYIYILLVLLLPFNIPHWLLLLLGFATGFVVDYFSSTIGLHTSATLVLAYLRPFIHQRWSFKSVRYEYSNPDLANVSLEWFSIYVVVSVLLHYTVLFMLETFTFHHFYLTIFRILLSTILSSAFIIIFEILRVRNVKRLK